MTVLAEMPELGQINRRQAAALAGLSPDNRDSGKWDEPVPPSAAGGPKCAVASTWPRFRPAAATTCSNRFYDRLIAAGKPAKVALTAVMRKLIVLMNHLLKNPEFALAK